MGFADGLLIREVRHAETLGFKIEGMEPEASGIRALVNANGMFDMTGKGLVASN